MEKWWVWGVFPGRSSALGVLVLAGEGFRCDPYCLRDCILATLLLSIPNTPNAGPGARVPFSRSKSYTLEMGPEHVGKHKDLKVSHLKTNVRKGRFFQMF